MSEVWRTPLPTSEKMVLLVIADHASDDGDNAYPSQQTIATKASLSVRTVQRVINDLVAQGYVWRAKGQGGSANCRDDRRPHLYKINLAKLRGVNLTGRQPDANEASSATVTGRQIRPMNHPFKPSLETSNSFELFWAAYPRKTAKGAARKAWDKCNSLVYSEIIEGAKRFAADPNRDATFTPHPATWLNGERWLDEPLPPKRSENVPRGVITTPTITPPPFDPSELPKGVPMPEGLKDILRRV